MYQGTTKSPFSSEFIEWPKPCSHWTFPSAGTEIYCNIPLCQSPCFPMWTFFNHNRVFICYVRPDKTSWLHCVCCKSWWNRQNLTKTRQNQTIRPNLLQRRQTRTERNPYTMSLLGQVSLCVWHAPSWRMGTIQPFSHAHCGSLWRSLVQGSIVSIYTCIVWTPLGFVPLLTAARPLWPASFTSRRGKLTGMVHVAYCVFPLGVICNSQESWNVNQIKSNGNTA